MRIKSASGWQGSRTHRLTWVVLGLLLLLPTAGSHGAMMLKDYVVRYDRGWDILCDPYQVKEGDWVLKIFRQKGEIAHEDFREFLGIFERLNPHINDIDRIRPGQIVDIPLKKLAQGNLPGQSTGVVTIPFVMLNNPREMLAKHTQSYTVQQGDTVSQIIAKRFGGRYGNNTYAEGLELFKTMNPQVKDLNRIYAGQKIYMPDPSVRERSWYADLFDSQGNLVDRKPPAQITSDSAPVPVASAVRESAPPQPPEVSQTPIAEAAGAMGGRLLDKGTYFLPMKKGDDFELDLSRFPVIDLQNGAKVIVTDEDRVMDVDLSSVQAYWDNVKVAKVPENASPGEILEAVLASISNGAFTNRLAFDDGAAAISVTAKWIQSGPSPDGSVPRHICITPIPSAAQRTHEAVVRYLDQNDIIIKDVVSGTSEMPPPLNDATVAARDVHHIDGSSQRSLVDSFAREMSFHYSPNTSISFPYAGIQVKALSNLLSLGDGREFLIDFGDLYGDAIKAIKETGLQIIQIEANATALDILQRLMQAAGRESTRSPVFYAANRPAEYNTAITVNGLLIPTRSGENRLFVDNPIPELIARFILDQGIEPVQIDTASQ